MATHLHNPPPALVTPNTQIIIKISTDSGEVKKLRLPLRDLEATTLVDKLRDHLKIPEDQDVTFERFSDSLGGYVKLDKANRDVFKSLQRAAKAKLKLRLKATTVTISTAALPVNTGLPAASSQAVQPSRSSQPLVAQSSKYPPESVADPPSVARGVFDFRATPKKKSDISLAFRPSCTVQQPIAGAITGSSVLPSSKDMANPTKAAQVKPPAGLVDDQSSTWVICCNSCDQAMTGVHFHCSICDAGDFDLCETCIAKGQMCDGKEHWLVKRDIHNGQVISSTTERLPPRSTKPASLAITSAPVSAETRTSPKTVTPSIPGAFTIEPRQLVLAEETLRTCNNCIDSCTEDNFVNCRDCPDFDLCLKCHVSGTHGHHPAHSFQPACTQVNLTAQQKLLLEPGRSVIHEAVCDGCDKTICGVRHKCFDCPNFDYCGGCVNAASLTHPTHRFGPVYEPLTMTSQPPVRHEGILCDGDACQSKSGYQFIKGIRYKCVVCDDVDFCADCEALPGSCHNETHPLLKIKSPVRDINVSTVHQNQSGRVLATVGDKPTDGTLNTAAPVRTVAETRPSAQAPPAASQPQELNAHFIRDSIVDGTKVAPNQLLTQIWTLRNPGPATWPAGCSVKYVGGDNMLDVDPTQASAASTMASASHSTELGRDLPPGEKHQFEVRLRAPSRPGKAISYWRLKAVDGTVFGHRLWCHVEVEAKAAGSDSSVAVNETKSKPFVHDPFTDHASERPTTYAEYEAQLDLLRLKNMQRMSQAQMSERNLESYYSKYQDRMRALRAVHCSAVSDGHQSKSASLPVAVTETAGKSSETKSDAVTISATPKTSSRMVFPTLERESPNNSVSQLDTTSSPVAIARPRQEIPPSAIETTSEQSAISPVAPVIATEEEPFDDLGEDLVVMSADGDNTSDDEGFLTDEEYDILDASDQETVVSSS